MIDDSIYDIWWWPYQWYDHSLFLRVIDEWVRLIYAHHALVLPTLTYDIHSDNACSMSMIMHGRANERAGAWSILGVHHVMLIRVLFHIQYLNLHLLLILFVLFIMSSICTMMLYYMAYRMCHAAAVCIIYHAAVLPSTLPRTSSNIDDAVNRYRDPQQPIIDTRWLFCFRSGLFLQWMSLPSAAHHR